MTFHIVTLFPQSFDSYLGESILKRAIEDKKIKVKFYNPRDFETDTKWRVDQKPYGGGPGMVIRALPVIKAIAKAVGRKTASKKVHIIFLSPSGTQFTNEYAAIAAQTYTDIVIVSGRYEGIDARVKKVFTMHDVSVGPFVLTGGELPAMILIDCISRQIKGVLGDFNSREETRVASAIVYTRPEEFIYKGKRYKVPDILLSGDHKKIKAWRRAAGPQ